MSNLNKFYYDSDPFINDVSVLKNVYSVDGYLLFKNRVTVFFNNLKYIVESDLYKKYKSMPIIEIIKESYGDMSMINLYNYSSICLMYHTFFSILNKIKCDYNYKDDKIVYNIVHRDFGGFANMKNTYLNKVEDVFGSCWICLTIDSNGKLEWFLTLNAFNPLNIHTVNDIVACFPFWEHNYLMFNGSVLDYGDKLYNNLINWEYISSVYSKLI